VRGWVPPDRLFKALDGQELSVSGSAWRIVVYAVVDESGRRWVQIALQGARPTVLTLRLQARHDFNDVVRELSSWLIDPSTTESVMERVA